MSDEDYRKMMEENRSLKGRSRKHGETEKSTTIPLRAINLYAGAVGRVPRRRCAADLLREEYLRKQKRRT